MFLKLFNFLYYKNHFRGRFLYFLLLSLLPWTALLSCFFSYQLTVLSFCTTEVQNSLTSLVDRGRRGLSPLSSGDLSVQTLGDPSCPGSFGFFQWCRSLPSPLFHLASFALVFLVDF